MSSWLAGGREACRARAVDRMRAAPTREHVPIEVAEFVVAAVAVPAVDGRVEARLLLVQVGVRDEALERSLQDVLLRAPMQLQPVGDAGGVLDERAIEERDAALD